ncbi:MAG: tetratricopeptide repeat-containing sensor histidine kinase [Arcticibacter sp.]
MRSSLILSGILVLIIAACREKTPADKTVKTDDYKKAESFLTLQKDSAFYYFNKIATTSGDSLQRAVAYNQMATIALDAGDFFGSQEILLRSLQYLDKTNPKHRSCLASDYNALGMATMNLKNYKAALPYYDAALDFSDNQSLRLIILNNKALTYQRSEKYADALKIYKEVLAAAEKGGKEYARTLSNKGRTEWQLRPDYHAAPELLTALEIRIRAEDLWGQNASYSHLTDYYSARKPDSALFFARKRYEVAQRLNSAMDRIPALRELIKHSPPGAAQRYFSEYQRLSDSVQVARNAAKNQFALIRYEAQEAKADNLELQKDVTEKKYQIIRQNIVLYTVIVLFIFITVIALLWYRKRKQRLHLEAENRIRKIQLQTSKKVHDVVANGLYRIMTEVEHRDELDREQLLDKIEVLYEQSRDISYESPETNEDDFHVKIAGLLGSFATQETKVLIAGNSKDFWEEVGVRIVNELEPILQELMVNMTKHSHAKTVVVRFERQRQHVVITYTDDGKGFPSDLKYGNGLVNTENRIKELNGSVSFETNNDRGLKVRILVPVQ